MNNIYFVSGGKDSTAMLIRALEEGEDVNRVMFLDTTLEFPELYEYLDRVDEYVKGYGVHVERLITSQHSFEHLFYRPHQSGASAGRIQGFPYAAFSGFCWIRREFKKFPKPRPHADDCHHIGIAYDERHRTNRKTYSEEVACVGCAPFADNCNVMTTRISKHYRFPLIEWKMTERDCLNFLADRDLLNPLYERFKRIGCWLCPYQSKKSLEQLYLHYPEYWNQLLIYEHDSPQQYLIDGSLKDLGIVFGKRNGTKQMTLT